MYRCKLPILYDFGGNIGTDSCHCTLVQPGAADYRDEIAESTVLCALKILLPTKKINIGGLRCGPSNQAGPKEAAQS